MKSLNRVQVMGNLTRDPELKYTSNGTALAKVGIAVNRSYKDKNSNDWKEVTTFVDVTFWDKLAEKIAQLHKGDRIYVEGRLNNDEWKLETGEVRKKLAVIGQDFFSSANTKSTNLDVADEEPEAEEAKTDGKKDNDEDIPF